MNNSSFYIYKTITCITCNVNNKNYQKQEFEYSCSSSFKVELEANGNL